MSININSSNELRLDRLPGRYSLLLIHNRKLHNKIVVNMTQKMYRNGSEWKKNV